MSTRPVDVALATCSHLHETDFDAVPLREALDAAGLHHVFWAWDDPAARWDTVPVAVLRSTWDYHRRPDEFLAWVATTARATALWNPPAAVRWNVHKSYLLDLDAAGVPVVPTEVIRRDAARSLAEVIGPHDWPHVVVKPAVSASSDGTCRFTTAAQELAAGEAHLRSLLARGDALVQPYMPAVADTDGGERALIWIDGELTHAVRKQPRFDGDPESVSATAVPIAGAERALAEAALATLPDTPFYARVDVVRGAAGTPVVMELELIEPSLYFAQSAPALHRFVAGINQRVAAARRTDSPRLS